ncbi:MAG TPA: glycosyltransferase family 2 protein [Polyangiaceae bacterium]|jgi:cellulose synthase/poly-beta-1,6-N-acetylglucosamine synthase-like glycosyltransferase
MPLRPFVDIALIAASAPVVAWTGYLFTLTVMSRRDAPEPPPEPRLRFDIVVPAHNEEKNIASTVRSLLATDYPPEMRRVIVVADNCSDATAERARAAGATAIERKDPSRRGKGYALAFAFEHILREGVADAVVVVDADSEVSPNFLRAFAGRFQAGAPAVQARYGVRNREASWRTRLMAIGLGAFHDLRSLGRERLGVSCGLRGNGMGFTRALLRDVPHDAFSIVEDVEYGIRLGRLGHRVWYVDEAEVLGEMVATEAESRSQRSRWEGGRWQLARKHGPKLLLDALRERKPLLLDLAMDMLVPPLSYIALAAAAGTAVTAAAVVLGLAHPVVLVPWGMSVVFVGAYVARGTVLSGAGWRGFVDLAAAPVYVTWKVALAARGSKKKSAPQGEWVRTARTGERAP